MHSNLDVAHVEKDIIVIKENRTNKSYIIKVKDNNIKEEIDGI